MVDTRTRNTDTLGPSPGPPPEAGVPLPTAYDINELRARNQKHSPLLRLPYEIVVHILLLVMDDMYRKSTPTWATILPTCHQLGQLVLSTPELWGRIFCTFPHNFFRRFELAAWSPTEIHVFGCCREDEEIGAALERVRGACQLHRDKIHTLEFAGTSRLWSHFSWIFDEPLPDLKDLRLSFAKHGAFDIPISLTDAVGTHLETLSIENAALPASSYSFYNMRNLRIAYSPELTVQRVVTILDSSRRLETLSLSYYRHPLHNDSQPVKRVVTLSHLRSLSLDAPPSIAASILDRLYLPAIDTLAVPLKGLTPSDIQLFFTNKILASHLLKATPNSPYLISHETARMGGFQLDRSPTCTSNWADIFPAMHEMVSSSVTELEMIRDTLDERHWREFARRRPDVHSIVSSYESTNYGRSKGLWCALLPDRHGHPAVLFPKLESVTLKAEHLSTIPSIALRCLRMRSEAGFKLKRLEVQDTCGKIRHVGRQPEDFRSLADEFVYRETPAKPREVDGSE